MLADCDVVFFWCCAAVLRDTCQHMTAVLMSWIVLFVIVAYRQFRALHLALLVSAPCLPMLTFRYRSLFY